MIEPLRKIHCWIRINIFCRLGLHRMVSLFADDEIPYDHEYPHMDYCVDCGKHGMVEAEVDDE